jgi:hypothetical protein
MAAVRRKATERRSNAASFLGMHYCCIVFNLDAHGCFVVGAWNRIDPVALFGCMATILCGVSFLSSGWGLFGLTIIEGLVFLLL